MIALVLASCGMEEEPGAHQLTAALESDGGTACTLEGATTAGLQGNCAAGQWCNLDTATCQTEYLPAGAAIPLPGAKHGCTGVTALSACASGSCNAAGKLCGCQIDQDCPSGHTCDQGSFDCKPPAGAGFDAGADADAADADTVTDAGTSSDAAAGAGGSGGAGGIGGAGGSGGAGASGGAGGSGGSGGSGGGGSSAGADGGAAGQSAICGGGVPCVGSDWCNEASGTCERPKELGKACDSHAQCRSRFCDAVCIASLPVPGSNLSGGGGGGCTYAGDAISPAAWGLVGLLFAASLRRRSKR
jgi:hypothetical protein